jgi:hypothetical protein
MINSKNNMKNPMQYFREGFETKKKMMLGGMVLDEVNVVEDKTKRKKLKAAKKSVRKGKQQCKKHGKIPMCKRRWK